jgi:hypothetical protein
MMIETFNDPERSFPGIGTMGPQKKFTVVPEKQASNRQRQFGDRYVPIGMDSNNVHIRDVYYHTRFPMAAFPTLQYKPNNLI